MTQRKPYATPTVTETPARQLLGHGQVLTHDDYTPERLQKLCEDHTMSVWRLQVRTRQIMPRSCLLADVNRLRAIADVLNERIDADAYGGTGGTGDEYPFADLPAVRVSRANLNLAAQRALNELQNGLPGIAHCVVRTALDELSSKGY